MRGASYLAGIDLVKQERSGNSVIVVDVGGTTTDVGVLLPSGFPRQAAAFIKGASNNPLKLSVTILTFFSPVAGVRTKYYSCVTHAEGS
jgi:N-methylhydantoinase A/oxoprolinase/acetone carboxylase beta subunit